MEIYQDLVSLIHFPTSHFLQMPTCVNALELFKSWIMVENRTLRNFGKVGQRVMKVGKLNSRKMDNGVS